MITLYRKHVHGIGTWKIWNEGQFLFIAHATVEDGNAVIHREEVVTNLSGRSLQEQIELRARSRINRMLDRGYKYSRDEALLGNTNQLGLLPPMLAQPLSKVSSINYVNAVLQKKLDGHRCLITKDEGEIIPYSRKGKLIPSITHITDVLKERLSEGVTLDGELYHHGTPLQTIGSWIKRHQENTKNLAYVVYDLISDQPFLERYEELKRILDGVGTFPVVLLPNVPYESEEKMLTLLTDVRARKFEGLILRTNDSPYQPGVRSSSLIKVKVFLDTEVQVKGFKRSKEGWAICICDYGGKRVDVSAPGGVAEKTYVLEHQDEFLDRYLTIEYSVITIDGVPFHPTAVRWRDDI